MTTGDQKIYDMSYQHRPVELTNATTVDVPLCRCGCGWPMWVTASANDLPSGTVQITGSVSPIAQAYLSQGLLPGHRMPDEPVEV